MQVRRFEGIVDSAYRAGGPEKVFILEFGELPMPSKIYYKYLFPGLDTTTQLRACYGTFILG
jgi:hypothetical protein